jgi:hypothetical protein
MIRAYQLGLAAILGVAGLACAHAAWAAPVHFIVTTLPDGCANQPYPKTQLVEGGVPPYGSLIEGVAPQGIDVNKAGELFGPLDDAGKFHFTVTIRDKARPGEGHSQDYHLLVKDCPKP